MNYTYRYINYTYRYINYTYIYINSACEKCQATRAKVAPVKLIYGSHFSGTKATYEVSQNIYFFLYIITIYLQEVDIIIGSPILC